MNNTPIIVDTREAFEYQTSHVDGALNISPEEFLTGEVPLKLRDIAKDQAIILYCRSGQRSNTCSMILRQHGFTKVINGINEQRVRQLIKVHAV